MVVEPGAAVTGNRDVIAAFLDDYRQELAGHWDFAVGTTDVRSRPYLDAYFPEPGRHASASAVTMRSSASR